ncbi:hypothetical protein PCASD_13301 [Puccinia coronata f. sp. avenae]|uniref:Reverse transcriptase Ty1/copia-type domain-containing protein n=1 Tax=Puccinia coronata f. sp. avenae TaxID=200324 RepID=A0A2N5U8V6_9BASI|nr:hypothetical protein PCASD_13301 [Puccinia coronata f. sp. avenae]
MEERANQAILTKARCLLVQSKLPKMFWADAINTATQLSNLTPSSTCRMKVPYETWTGRTANLDVLQPFGCLTYVLIPKEKREFKLNPTAEKGIMIGSDSSCQDIFDVATHLRPPEDSVKAVPNPLTTLPLPSRSSDHLNIPKAPNDISSQISTDNILSVNRRGNSIIVYLTENVKSNTLKTYLQAINSPNSTFWKKAIQKEVSNMYNHDVWAIVKKSGEQNRINCTWVFKVKKDQLNVPIEYKACLCAKGFQQTKGTNYAKTFAPTGKMVSLRMLIVFALKNDLKFHQINIKSAFLNAPLQEELYFNPL